MCGLFASAVEDYRYLRERGYPPQAALKLVGDRHSLSRRQRNVLFRGTLARAAALERSAKLMRPEAVRGLPLGVDWYNVVITVESYLRGAPVFMADDGVVRDAAAAHGGYRSSGLTERAIDVLLSAASALGPSRVDLYLDAPVAFSGDMAAVLRSQAEAAPFPTRVEAVDSPDYLLKSYPGVVASSDSAVLDRAPRVFDLPRYALQRSFGFEPPDVATAAAAR